MAKGKEGCRMDNQAAERYVESLFAEDADLERVISGIRANGMPEISIASGYGRLLTLLVKASGARRVLEIGALGGYSGICLARGLPADGELTSLELKAEYAELAGQHLAQAGLGERVRYMVGEALDSLQQLGDAGERFDFFFIDADKGNYPNYLDWALRLANPGAIIAGDNAFLHGRTMDPEENSHSIRALRSFNERMASDPRLDCTVLPAYDGLALARVK